MNIEQLVEKFYKDNVQISNYCHYDNCETEVDELIHEPDVFKDNLKRLLMESNKRKEECSG